MSMHSSSRFFTSFRICALIALGVLSTLRASAQNVVFTIDATATPTVASFGYVTGQSYRFAFTMNGATLGATSPAGPTAMGIFNVPTGLYTKVSGSGFGGTVATAAMGPSFLNALPGLLHSIMAFGPLGVTSPNNTPLISMDFIAFVVPLPTVYTGPQTTAATYFAPAFGTYAVSGFLNVMPGASLTMTSLTIASDAAAVPEPAEYAAIAGAGALALAWWRRRGAAARRAA